MTSLTAAAEPVGPWTTATQAGRVEARHAGALIMAWQGEPLANPAGGAKFSASAFLHPLRTPAGFEWTTIQPADHLHHFGLWWPWKFIDVDGKRYNCWEIQEGQGGHVARKVKQLASGAGQLAWEISNEVVVRQADAGPRAVIREDVTVGLSMSGSDAVVIDLAIRQQAVDKEVTIINYRYSGFSWRGPNSWNKDNSSMLTSEGHNRDNANGKRARWVVVSGSTPGGSASVLLMSAASDLAGAPEHLRVWDSKTLNGTPFVNFNPVAGTALPLNDAHPAVSNRKYRVVAADRTINAEAAESEWRKWLGK